MDLADLLTLGKKYLRDAMPGGVLNPEVTRQSVLDGAAIASSPVPVLGDLLGLGADVNRYATDPSSRTPGNYALSGLGLLPFVPAMGGVITDIRKPAWNSRPGQSIPVGVDPTPSEIRELLRDEQAKSAWNTLRTLVDGMSGTRYAWPADAALHQDIGHAFNVKPGNAVHGIIAP